MTLPLSDDSPAAGTTQLPQLSSESVNRVLHTHAMVSVSETDSPFDEHSCVRAVEMNVSMRRGDLVKFRKREKKLHLYDVFHRRARVEALLREVGEQSVSEI